MDDINKSWDLIRHGKTADRKQNAQDTRQTALHEAGHAIAYLINCSKHCMYQISISGRTKTLGHCVHLPYKINENYNIKDSENFIIAYLAGGICEQYFSDKKNIIEDPKIGFKDLLNQPGCQFDIKKARIIATYLRNKSKLINQKQTNQTLYDCYTKAAEIIKKHEELVIKLAEKLEEKNVLYVDEIYSSLNLTRNKFELE